MITLDEKPLAAHSIRVIFKCEEQDNARNITTIFSVESVIWGKPKDSGIHVILIRVGNDILTNINKRRRGSGIIKW